MAEEADGSLLRRQASEIFRAAIDAADPREAVRKALSFSEGRLSVAGRLLPGSIRSARVVAFGKAACAMAEAVEAILPPSFFPGRGVAVTSYASSRPLSRIEVIEAGHPLPDQNGLRGAQAVAAVLSSAREDEVVLALISGGGSALLPSPAPGISLEEKIGVTRLLLESGADIGELNTVRKHLSTLKGGGMARAIAPAPGRALILSDVIGDDLGVIASGPFAPDPTTFADALEVLRRRGLLGRVSPSIRRRLEAGARGEVPETPKPGDPIFDRVECDIIGSNRLSLTRAVERARSLGYVTRIFSSALTGEAREAGARIAAVARSAISEPGAPARLALLSGGETTVTVRGSGRGGRNQELALAFAIHFKELGLPLPHVFLSAGTDGVDGPTDAAGGIVDSGTIDRILRQGIDPLAALDQNDSYRALNSSGDLIFTRPTGTNVADLEVLLIPRGP